VTGSGGGVTFLKELILNMEIVWDYKLQSSSFYSP
jgi:hypothetical protein